MQNPLTAKFSIFGWSYGREFNIYSASSIVTASNGYGIEIKIPFTVKYFIEGDTTEVIYVMLDGEVILDDKDKYSLPERK